MDLTKSLVYNLQGSSLIEHPVIVIAHQSHAAYFQQGNFFKFIILIQYIYIYIPKLEEKNNIFFYIHFRK